MRSFCQATWMMKRQLTWIGIVIGLETGTEVETVIVIGIVYANVN